MRLIAKCQSCKKRKLFIRKRRYETKHAGLITSQNELCNGCAKGIQSLMKKMNM